MGEQWHLYGKTAILHILYVNVYEIVYKIDLFPSSLGGFADIWWGAIHLGGANWPPADWKARRRPPRERVARCVIIAQP